MSARKSSHRTIFLIVSSRSPLALIASSLRSTSKKPFCPMTRSLHPPITACGHRVRFAETWREEFFVAPKCFFLEIANTYERKGGKPTTSKIMRLFDLNENKEYGIFVGGICDGCGPMTCLVQDQVCQSESEWRQLLKPFMED